MCTATPATARVSLSCQIPRCYQTRRILLSLATAATQAARPEACASHRETQCRWAFGNRKRHGAVFASRRLPDRRAEEGMIAHMDRPYQPVRPNSGKSGRPGRPGTIGGFRRQVRRRPVQAGTFGAPSVPLPHLPAAREKRFRPRRGRPRVGKFTNLDLRLIPRTPVGATADLPVHNGLVMFT